MEQRLAEWLGDKGSKLGVTVNIYHHSVKEDVIVEKLDRILAVLRDGQRKEELAMATLQEQLDKVLAKVTEENTVINSLGTLTAQIKAMLDQALSGELTPEQQAKFDAVFAVVDDNLADAAAAITANTEPEVPPPPPIE